MSEERFTALLGAAREGSEAAWAEIYRELSPALVGYLRVSGEPEPEDALGEIFLQVARDVGGFEGSWPKFRSWVFTIAHHRMIDDRRRSQRQPFVAGEVEVEDHRALGDVEDDAFAVLGSDRVRELLGVLSPDQRAVVLLRVVADLSVEDVATILGKREGAIKALQHRAMGALRRHLARQPLPL